MPTIMLLRGIGGATADVFCPALAELGDLVTLYAQPENPIGDVEQELSIMRRSGQLIRTDDPNEATDLGLQYARSHRIDGVFTLSEPMLAHSARIAQALGLPHHSVEATELMRDKHLQRKRLDEAGVPVPAYCKVSSTEDGERALGVVPLPAVLKPVHGAGSLLTFLIEGPQDLRRRLEEARALYSRSPIVAGETPAFMLEQLLVGQDWHGDPHFGDYVSVESLVFQDEIHHLCVTDKNPLASPFRETGDILPSCLESGRQREILEMATRAIQACRASNGATHTEIKLTAEGPRVIEVNGRLGGPMAWLLPAASDLNVVREIGKLALGVVPNTAPRFSGFATWMTPQAPAAEVRVSSSSGIEAARALPGVRHALALQQEGSTPDWKMVESTEFGLMAVAPTMAELLRLQDRILDTVKFEYEPAAAVT